jgi:hypothetical protein
MLCALGLLFVWGTARAEPETWRGQIHCIVVPGLQTIPLVGTFVVVANGASLTYSRPVHVADSASPSGVTETGSGSLVGTEIKIQGGAADKDYSYTASYAGRMEGNAASLTGEQVWTARKLAQPFHRSCSIALTR